MSASKKSPIQHINPKQPFDIADAVLKRCEQCNGEYFTQALKIGIISAVSPRNHTGQDVIVRFDAFLCKDCGHEFGVPVEHETKQ